MLWAAMGMFGAVTSAVNHAWGVEKDYGFFKHKLIAFVLMLCAGIMAVSALLITSFAQIVEARWFSGVLARFPELQALTGFAYRNVATPAFILVIGLTYYFVPNTRVRLRDVWFGAVLAGLLWRLLFAGFAWYVRDLSRFSVHGSVAAVVVFLLWVYLSAVIFLYGVEVTAAWARLRKAFRDQRRAADLSAPGPEAASSRDRSRARSLEPQAPSLTRITECPIVSLGERSPYLLQHADNPVDWYPWGDEAFARARAEDKPIFLSIGYSTCHWCHVMAHESFEDDAVAAVLNEHFVPIKLDREERPDVDRVYMLFVQATTGAGGWPMSVWLTPESEAVFRRHLLSAFLSVGPARFRGRAETARGRLAQRARTNHDIRRGHGRAAEEPWQCGRARARPRARRGPRRRRDRHRGRSCRHSTSGMAVLAARRSSLVRPSCSFSCARTP